MTPEEKIAEKLLNDVKRVMFAKGDETDLLSWIVNDLQSYGDQRAREAIEKAHKEYDALRTLGGKMSYAEGYNQAIEEAVKIAKQYGPSEGEVQRVISALRKPDGGAK